MSLVEFSSQSEDFFDRSLCDATVDRNSMTFSLWQTTSDLLFSNEKATIRKNICWKCVLLYFSASHNMFVVTVTSIRLNFQYLNSE